MICIVTAGKTFAIAASAFTLSWTHSIERTRWEERWTLAPAGLQLVEARVKGSGAGVEPGDGAVLKDGWWRWVPRVPPQKELLLAASGATGEGWTLCAKGGCALLGERPADPAVVRACGVHDDYSVALGLFEPSQRGAMRRAQAGPGPRM